MQYLKFFYYLSHFFQHIITYYLFLYFVDKNNIYPLDNRLISRTAILWHELWHEGLEEASRLFFGERDVAGMFETLEPLHEMMDKGPQTLKETSFSQNYGNELNEAQKWCKRYKVSNNIKDLNQAWDLYYHVFRLV
jgi:phosphatidylinositol kinase/protein kinase (PI-3  family)